MNKRTELSTLIEYEVSNLAKTLCSPEINYLEVKKMIRGSIKKILKCIRQGQGDK